MVASSTAGQTHTHSLDTFRHTQLPSSQSQLLISGPHLTLLFTVWYNLYYTISVNHDWIFSATNSQSTQVPCGHWQICLPYSTHWWGSDRISPTAQIRNLESTWPAHSCTAWDTVQTVCILTREITPNSFLKINKCIWFKNYHLENDITRSVCSWALSTSEKRQF